MSYARKNYGTHSLMTLPSVKTLHKGSFDNALSKKNGSPCNPLIKATPITECFVKERSGHSLRHTQAGYSSELSVKVL